MPSELKAAATWKVDGAGSSNITEVDTLFKALIGALIVQEIQTKKYGKLLKQSYNVMAS
uniref:Uncharacterized protein n=1 Tax=Helianthus annuus TaxID=4232 RepID=A0A251SZ33_HELAN